MDAIIITDRNADIPQAIQYPVPTFGSPAANSPRAKNPKIAIAIKLSRILAALIKILLTALIVNLRLECPRLILKSDRVFQEMHHTFFDRFGQSQTYLLKTIFYGALGLFLDAES